MNTAANAAAAAAAAPAWRQFPVFNSTTPSIASTSQVLIQPGHLSAHVSSPENDLFLVADLDGKIEMLGPEMEVLVGWQAFGDEERKQGRCTLMAVGEGRWGRILVAVGEEDNTAVPLLKIYSLPPPTNSPPLSAPILLREARITPPGASSTPHPITSLALSPNLSHIIIGLADGSVLAFRHVYQLLDSASTTVATTPTLGLRKLRLIHSAHEPITALGITTTLSSTSTPLTTLFILTTTHTLSYSLSSKDKHAQASVLDDTGAGVGCASVVRSKGGESRVVVARDEAVFVYGPEGREGSVAFEGPKSSLHTVTSSISFPAPSSASQQTSPSPYILIVSPPQTSTIASNSATIRNYARNGFASSAQNSSSSPSTSSDVAKITIFDLENKFVAYTGTYEDGVRAVFECWGYVWVLAEQGKLFRLAEQPLQNSLKMMFGRNLYTLAVSLAMTRGLPKSEVAEIYRRYGDHLYSKADYEGAMGCYLKTVGSVQASYVIRKFLDAQRLSHLTSYLQELHSRGLANSDHTTLLLNCYTKLADDTALSSFLHSSSASKPIAPPPTSTIALNGNAQTTDEPPFDLETAIRVCRQAGYFDHAVWLAQRYGAHEEYLRIQIEDRKDYADSIRYLRKLKAEVAEEMMVRYGKTLLREEPKGTTRLLVDLCCGGLTLEDEEGDEEKGGEGKEESRKAAADKSYMSYLAYAIPSAGAPEAGVPIHALEPAPGSAPTTLPNTPNLDVANAATAQNRKSGIYPHHQIPDSIPASLHGDVDTTSERLPSPRQFFADYVDHPLDFIRFLESVAQRRYGKTLTGVDLTSTRQLPLAPPQPVRAAPYEDTETRDEQSIWNTLLELYLSPATEKELDEEEATTLKKKALQLLREREKIPYDETQALLVCTTAGFTDGTIMLYEQLGMYDDIVRYWMESSASGRGGQSSTKVIRALERYGPSTPHLYRMVLRYLTTSSELLSRHQADIVDILDEVDRENIMPPITVVQILSTNGTASIGLVREYLKKQLSAEKQEIEADRGLITSYRSESAKKRKDIQELSDPKTPRIFQVTRCSSCGGQLDLPSVHFMCRHSYHQRCLAENESQCPNCARTHGVIREIRKNNEEMASRHDLFLAEVAESEDGFATVSGAFGKGVMSLAVDEGS